MFEGVGQSESKPPTDLVLVFEESSPLFFGVLLLILGIGVVAWFRRRRRYTRASR